MADPIDRVRRVMEQPEDIDMGGVPVAGGDEPWPEGDWVPDDGLDVAGPEPGEADGPPGDATPSPEDERHAEAAGHPMNDIGNGRRLATYFGEDVLHVQRVGWYVWDETRWAADRDKVRVRTRAQKVSELMLHEIAHLELEPWEKKRIDDLPRVAAAARTLEAKDRTPEESVELDGLLAKIRAGEALKQSLQKRRAEFRRFAKSSGNTGKIESMMKEAEIGLNREFEAMDADPIAVNTKSGTLKFSVSRSSGDGDTRVASVVLQPHDRADLVTKCMNVVYDPQARTPLFDAFLKRIMPDPEMRGFLQRSFGLAMTARLEQRMWFFYGHGANGKSVLVDLIAQIMGDYSATAKIETLTGQTRRGGADATPDLVPLMGARLVRASEPEQGERLKEGIIKELTGGEPILVRALHSDFIEVKPVFKLFISGNHKPEIRGTDDGIWRRVLMVLFNVQIPERERDQELGRKLFEEAPGILNWMVDGLIDYLERGLQVPQQVADATQAYREENDPIGLFLDACGEVTGDAGTFTRSADLTDAFNFWMAEQGSTQWSGRQFQLKLRDKADRWRDPRTGLSFMASKRSVSGYQGLALTAMFRRRMEAAIAEGKWKRAAGTSSGMVDAAGDAGGEAHDF
jgi:putative DNA primase/helicase